MRQDQLRYLKSYNLIGVRKNGILKEGDNSVLECKLEMHFMVIKSGTSGKFFQIKVNRKYCVIFK